MKLVIFFVIRAGQICKNFYCYHNSKKLTFCLKDRLRKNLTLIEQDYKSPHGNCNFAKSCNFLPAIPVIKTWLPVCSRKTRLHTIFIISYKLVTIIAFPSKLNILLACLHQKAIVLKESSNDLSN